jgi:hypothetical protein
MATTTNYGWTTPDNTALVKDGASAIRSLGSAIDTTANTLSQGQKEYAEDTAGTLTLTTTTETELFRATSFTPISTRLYLITVSVGEIQKTTGAGNVTVRLRKDSTTGAVIMSSAFSFQAASWVFPYSKTIVGTLGSTAFTPVCTIQTNTNGVIAKDTTYEGIISIVDIGLA